MPLRFVTCKVRPDLLASKRCWEQHFLKLDGSYGEEFTPIAQWVYNYVHDASRPINFGWNMKKFKLSAQLRIQFYRFGALGEWVKMQSFQKRRDGTTTRVDGAEPYYLTFSLEARRRTLRSEPCISACHMVPLGEMTVTKTLQDHKRQKILLSILAI